MFQNRLKKWNKKIWIAKKIGTKQDEYGYLVPIYSRPQLYFMNVQPINSSADMQEFGEHASQMQKAIIESNKYLGTFKEFDIAYLDGVTPLENGGEFVANISEINMAQTRDIDEIKIKNLATGEITCYTCENANYRLYPPRNQNKCIALYFERITK